jgi:hypothetical protein
MQLIDLVVSQFRGKMGNNDLLCFVHIEKAAGTTLNHILRTNFLFKHYDVRPFSQKSAKNFTISDLKKTMSINPFVMSISGHSIKPYIGLEQYYPNIKYITLLRNPVNRYLSHFFYRREVLKRDIDFQSYLIDNDMWNFQTKKIAGRSDFQMAQKILSNKFFLVGIVEDFDTFLLLLKDKLNLLKFQTPYRKQNVSNPKSNTKERISYLVEKYYDQIILNNADDIKLYEFVKNDLYPKECDLYGGNNLNFEDTMPAEKNVDFFNWHGVRWLDYLYRKIYIDPVTGCIRIANGLNYKGSY